MAHAAMRCAKQPGKVGRPGVGVGRSSLTNKRGTFHRHSLRVGSSAPANARPRANFFTGTTGRQAGTANARGGVVQRGHD
eukprot:7382871-Prymnesium_polylepis.1